MLLFQHSCKPPCSLSTHTQSHNCPQCSPQCLYSRHGRLLQPLAHIIRLCVSPLFSSTSYKTPTTPPHSLSKAFAISFMWTVEVRRNMRRSEAIERTSDAAHKPSIRHQSSSTFFVSPTRTLYCPLETTLDYSCRFQDSRFAHTVHMSRLPQEQNEIELGYQHYQQQYDEHDKDQESSYDMQTLPGHSSAVGSHPIHSDLYRTSQRRRIDLA